MSVTIGSFTVSDNDAFGGGGCSDINMVNNSTTQTADWGLDQYDNFNDQSLAPGASTSTSSFGNLAASGFVNVLFSGAELDGSSMITGIVGNSGNQATQQANQNIPCINMGGVAGM
jgi:hypothetical protein